MEPPALPASRKKRGVTPTRERLSSQPPPLATAGLQPRPQPQPEPEPEPEQVGIRPESTEPDDSGWTQPPPVSSKLESDKLSEEPVSISAEQVGELDAFTLAEHVEGLDPEKSAGVDDGGTDRDEGSATKEEQPREASALLSKVGRQSSSLLIKGRRSTRTRRQEQLDEMLKAPYLGAATFSPDHELAMKMDSIFPKLVIKREEATEDMKLRVVAKDDVVHGGFYILFYLIFFWVVTDQLDMRNRFELEGAIADYIGGEPWDEANHYALNDLDSLEAIWVWLENVFVPCLFVDPEWYNGDSFTAQEEGFMMQYNKLVGGFQLLQKRVPANDEDCDPSPRFGDWAGNCYDEYYHDRRSEEPFGPPHDPEKYLYWAGNSREQAGFHVRFPLDRDFAIRQLQELKNDKFLDKHTRDLQIDFTVYNENKHLFCAVTIHIQQLNSGMIETEFDMSSIALEPYAVGDKTIAVTPRMICEILIVLYVLMQAYDELMEIKDAGLWAHFCHTGGFWNVVDALRIAMFTISIIGYARILLDPVGWNLELPLPAGQIYVDFANLSEASEHYVLSCSIAIVLCLLSVMKYIRHSQAYGLLIITLAFAGPEIFRFMVMFSIVNLTFVIMGLIMFGNILEEFSTISRSFQTLMMMMTGEYGYEGIQEVSQVSAGIFYSLYLILVFFILVNMFLAIVFDAYAALQEVKDLAPSFPYRYSFMQEELRELRRGKFRQIFTCCSNSVRDNQKDHFFLCTEDMLALLEDPVTLGARNRPHRQVAAQEKTAEHFHHVQADQQFETIITYDDMTQVFGWGDIQARWLLSQLGVPDDQALEQSGIMSKETKALEAVVQRHIKTELEPVKQSMATLQAQLERQTHLLTELRHSSK